MPVVNVPRVLLVDDDADTCEMYAWSLEARGYQVTAVQSGVNAVAELGTDRFHVVVTDFTLPTMNGFELARRLRESADVPLILVSGRSLDTRDAAEAATLFASVLTKPVLPDSLADEIARVLVSATAERLRRQHRAIVGKPGTTPGADPDVLPFRSRASEADRMVRAVNESVESPLADAAFLADNEARYVAVNARACELAGRSREELLGMSVWDLTPGHDVRFSRRMWQDFLARGSMEGTYSIVQPDGTPVATWFSAHANVAPGLHLSLLAPLPQAIPPFAA